MFLWNRKFQKQEVSETGSEKLGEQRMGKHSRSMNALRSIERTGICNSCLRYTKGLAIWMPFIKTPAHPSVWYFSRSCQNQAWKYLMPAAILYHDYIFTKWMWEDVNALGTESAGEMQRMLQMGRQGSLQWYLAEIVTIMEQLRRHW